MHLCSAKKVPQRGQKIIAPLFFWRLPAPAICLYRDNRIAIPTLYKTDLGCPSIKYKPRMALRKIALRKWRNRTAKKFCCLSPKDEFEKFSVRQLFSANFATGLDLLVLSH
jgi:hypothetical protein